MPLFVLVLVISFLIPLPSPVQGEQKYATLLPPHWENYERTKPNLSACKDKNSTFCNRAVPFPDVEEENGTNWLNAGQQVETGKQRKIGKFREETSHRSGFHPLSWAGQSIKWVLTKISERVALEFRRTKAAIYRGIPLKRLISYIIIGFFILLISNEINRSSLREFLQIFTISNIKAAWPERSDQFDYEERSDLNYVSSPPITTFPDASELLKVEITGHIPTDIRNVLHHK